MDTIIQILARELGQKETYIQNVVNLIDEGNTIPFIARYRKEATGSLDDAALRDARLKLADTARAVIADGLRLLGVTAPEKM